MRLYLRFEGPRSVGLYRLDSADSVRDVIAGRVVVGGYRTSELAVEELVPILLTAQLILEGTRMSTWLAMKVLTPNRGDWVDWGLSLKAKFKIQMHAMLSLE